MGGVAVMLVVVGFGVGRITFWHFGPCLFDFVQFFSVVTCLAEKGDDFKIGLSTFVAVFELLGPKYTQLPTLFQKLVPVI